MYAIDLTKLIEIFCEADDFCQLHQEYLQVHGLPSNLDSCSKAGRKAQLSSSEVMCILLFYPLSGMKNFQYYYQRMVEPCLQDYFPGLVSYTRFVELISQHWQEMWMFTQYKTNQSLRTGHYYIDSKKLPVCHNRRIHQHKVFSGMASRGKSSTGWYYGLKLHLVINHLGQVVSFLLTTGAKADNNHKALELLLKDLKGTCYGDKGYISSLFEKFYQGGLQLITKTRKNMKQLLLNLSDALMLRKRGIIESVNDILMTVCDIEHTRHRSPINAITHILASLGAYCYLEHKPSLVQDFKILC
jgi:Transposase DDE domain